MKSIRWALALMLLAVSGVATRADTIRIGYSEMLSGSFAQAGDQSMKAIQFSIDQVNARGGVIGRSLELITYDNKAQPAEALVSLQKMIDDNLSIVMNCGPSNIVAALIPSIEKQNARDPSHRVVLVNCGSLAPELTNEKCSFWHFRSAIHGGMLAEIMVRALPKAFTKVYIINQDFLAGQSAQRDLKLFLAKLRPDVQVVGEDMIPVGKIKDFSSYVTKIKLSGAEAVLTGSGAPDLALLIKAGMDLGLPVEYYTMLAHQAGAPTAIGPGGDGRVHSVVSFHDNIGVEKNDPKTNAMVEAFRSKYGSDFNSGERYAAVQLVADAIVKAGSTDALKVALAMEDLTITDAAGQRATMRPEDHQILMTSYGAAFSKGVKYDAERTGLGWKTTAVVNASDLDQPITCKMKRPTN
jgi:branched-chain amino acid transport system substrate-binding protein